VAPRGSVRAPGPNDRPSVRTDPDEPVRLVTLPAVPYRRTPWWRRILSFGGLGIMAGVLGALLAVVIGLVIILAFLALSGTAR
jgi:hypothetical protein